MFDLNRLPRVCFSLGCGVLLLLLNIWRGSGPEGEHFAEVLRVVFGLIFIFTLPQGLSELHEYRDSLPRVARRRREHSVIPFPTHNSEHEEQ
jgi:hypothetical protein